MQVVDYGFYFCVSEAPENQVSLSAVLLDSTGVGLS